MFGEAARLVLRVDELSVDDDVEDATVALDQLRIDIHRLLDLGRQTGGLWKVVSAHAVLDRDLHLVLPGGVWLEPPRPILASLAGPGAQAARSGARSEP